MFVATHLMGFEANGIDPHTKLLLHCNGADASTTFTDSSIYRRIGTTAGNAQIDTAQSVFGGASALFDGTGDYISFPSSPDFDLIGDFTIDFWFRVTALSRTHMFLIRETNPVANILCRLNSSDGFDFTIRDSGSGLGSINVASGVSIDTWYHVAYVRSGSNFTLYKDGTSIGTASGSNAGTSGYSEVLSVGGRPSSSTQSVQGWMDELRISNGIARWTSNFTPPVRAYEI